MSIWVILGVGCVLIGFATLGTHGLIKGLSGIKRAKREEHFIIHRLETSTRASRLDLDFVLPDRKYFVKFDVYEERNFPNVTVIFKNHRGVEQMITHTIRFERRDLLILEFDKPSTKVVLILNHSVS